LIARTIAENETKIGTLPKTIIGIYPLSGGDRETERGKNGGAQIIALLHFIYLLVAQHFGQEHAPRAESLVT
jgi:hypothetical protein